MLVYIIQAQPVTLVCVVLNNPNLWYTTMLYYNELKNIHLLELERSSARTRVNCVFKNFIIQSIL